MDVSTKIVSRTFVIDGAQEASFYLLEDGNRLSPRKIAILERFGTIESSMNTFNLLVNGHRHIRVLKRYFVDSYRPLTNLICAVCLRDMII